MRQQVKKAMDISRMTAQLTMEAITATLNPKVSYFDMAAAKQTQKHVRKVSPGISLSHFH